MYKKIYSFLIFLSLAGLAYGGMVYNPQINSGFDMIQTVEEEDGAPSVPVATIIKVPNTTLTDNADGTASLNFGILTEAQDLDAVLTIGDTADTESITLTAGTLTASTLTDGTLTITGGALSTTGTGTFGDLVVDTNTLVVNAAGYTDRVGIGTTAPSSELDVTGTGTFGQITDNGLSASLGVYTDASKQLTSTAPSGGVLGYWNRDSDNGYIFQNTIADNIGLGTITPQAVLDVVDDIQTDALELRNIAGLTKLYDYNNITNPSSFHKAYMKQSLTASDMLSNPVTGYGGTEFSTTNYGLIWAAAGGAQNLANGTAYYLSIMCEMEIGEVADDVSSFDVYITDFNNHNRATFYHALWNNRTSTWDNIGGPYTLNTNRSITHTISANISDYITADKTVYYLQYTTTATTLLNSFRLVYISLTPTLVQTIATLEDNVRDDDIIVERTSPTALDVRQSDGTQIFNVSTASGATSLTTLNLENLISTGQTWFKYPKMGFGIGYEYSFSSSGAPVDDTIIRFAYGHDDIDTATNGLNMEYFYAPVTETTGEHWSARIGHNPTGTEYGTGSLIGNVAFNIKTDYWDAPFGSSDLDIRNIRSTGISLLGTTTGKSLTNMELTPYSIGAGTLTITEPVINLHLKNATGSVAGTLEQLVIEKPTGGSVANYQVVLAGNGVGTGIWFDSAERLYSDDTNLTSAAPILALDKIKFTQTDGNEYIDSLATGYMDYGATTQHRFNNTLDVTGDTIVSGTGTIDTLHITDRVGIGVTDPQVALDVTGAIASGTLIHSTTGVTDNLDITGVNTVFVDTTNGDITLGGLVGGVDGQYIFIVKIVAANDLTLEHLEGVGGDTDDFFMHQIADETIDAGGVPLVFDGVTERWYDISHAKHT